MCPFALWSWPGCSTLLPGSFLSFKDYVPQGNVDLVYCNGVFHHIPPAKQIPLLISSTARFGREGFSPSGRITPGIRGALM